MANTDKNKPANALTKAIQMGAEVGLDPRYITTDDDIKTLKGGRAMKEEKQTGVFDITFDEYLKIDAVNQSSLKNLDKCPLYYQYKRDNIVDTDAMAFGRMLHSYVLEPANFNTNYLVTPKIRRAGKEWEALKQIACNRQIVFEENLESTKCITKNLLKNKIFNSVFERSTRESSLVWNDADTGLLCKARLDGLAKFMHDGDVETHIIYDLKTTRDCSKRAFKKHFSKYSEFRYDIQAAFYLDAYAAVFGVMPDYFMVFAIETEPPYLVANYAIASNSNVIKDGRVAYKELLTKYKYCLDNNDFATGLDQSLEFIDFPEE